ncbi:phage tail protein, P2 GpE family [gamma proteobacterium HTCC5015]|nr:phage tail protein, P2 GpE family [gamma proteobacterium HTCC5015]
MADIAVIFHWGPDQMATMELADLLDWREQARQRSGEDQ